MSDKQYISEIYNYCDRWCERCAFTSRCRIFEAEEPGVTDYPDEPIDTPEFWEKMRDSFERTLEALQGMMDKLDAFEKKGNEEGDDEADEKDEKWKDLDEEDDDDDDDGYYNDPFPMLRPPRLDWPDFYETAVNNFFKTNEDFFGEQELKFDDQIKMGVPVDVEQLGFLHEALRTIRWFQSFIGTKIHRAVIHHQFNLKEIEELQGDGNGSAKVAMIALQRSMDAWKFIGIFFPDKNDETLEIIKTIKDTQMELVKLYPKWEVFHRPGFDDEPDTVVRLDYNQN
jgi:hypothetical protein